MKYAYLIFTGIVLTSCSGETNDKSDVKPEVTEQSEKPKYTYKVYLLKDVGWCYQIFKGPKMILNQKHIPAVQGVKGFDTEAKAEIAAKFILERVLTGDERPSVTPQELDSIGAIDLEPEINFEKFMDGTSNPPIEIPEIVKEKAGQR